MLQLLFASSLARSEVLSQFQCNACAHSHFISIKSKIWRFVCLGMCARALSRALFLPFLSNHPSLCNELRIRTHTQKEIHIRKEKQCTLTQKKKKKITNEEREREGKNRNRWTKKLKSYAMSKECFIFWRLKMKSYGKKLEWKCCVHHRAAMFKVFGVAKEKRWKPVMN